MRELKEMLTCFSHAARALIGTCNFICTSLVPLSTIITYHSLKIYSVELLSVGKHLYNPADIIFLYKELFNNVLGTCGHGNTTKKHMWKSSV